MVAVLSEYVNDTLALLHDQNALFTSKNQLIRWINLARRDTAKRTGCIRRLLSGQSAYGASSQPGAAIPGGMQPGALPNAFAGAQNNASQNAFQAYQGIERYPYMGFANPFLQQTHAGCKSIIDVGSVAISWGGTMRPSIDWLPWDDFQAYCRSYQLPLQDYPGVWSVENDGEAGAVWLFPTPSLACEMEWDVYAIPIDLNSDVDYDAIPSGFSEAIKLGAAKYTFLTKQNFIQAQIYEDMFSEHLGIDRVAVDRGKSSTYYPSRF